VSPLAEVLQDVPAEQQFLGEADTEKED